MPCALRLIEVGSVADDIYRLRGTELPHELTALRAARMINHNGVDFLHNLGVIYERVDDRICDGQREEKQKHTHIGKHKACFPSPDSE